ncbi:futalosine nucleosidase [Oleidesulfovibrio alaskensis G20]|uniref:Futalosine hydrolase n=1 Tax=Oleidesulfovibrio alaskensis (strain ATCC BAA-1058 / DSM 17464 / G20) TaxID=207559 RepID=Q30WG4_OLEA2|nr:futalosine hydrolase [Oleidesulfovibrio alaskensis]ABB39982.1 futalosine nucleosidase [Oleidesulfovibrio alaskensis G20]
MHYKSTGTATRYTYHQMTLIITTATTREMEAVLKGFNGRGRVGCVLPRQGEVCASPVNERQCLLAVTGVGPVNAAFTLGRLLGEHRNIDGVISLGIAGTFDPDAAPLGSTVLATRETWADYGLYTAQGVDPMGIGFGQTDDAVNPVWNSIELNPAPALAVLQLTPPPLCRTGGSLTVAAASGTAERACAMRQTHHALTENMEGFALALGCLRQGVPFLELRTVSNVVGSRAAHDWAVDDAFASLGQAARALFV